MLNDINQYDIPLNIERIRGDWQRNRSNHISLIESNPFAAPLDQNQTEDDQILLRNLSSLQNLNTPLKAPSIAYGSYSTEKDKKRRRYSDTENKLYQQFP